MSETTRNIESRYVVRDGEHAEIPDGTTYGPGAVIVTRTTVRDIYGDGRILPATNHPIGQVRDLVEITVDGNPVVGPIKIVQQFDAPVDEHPLDDEIRHLLGCEWDARCTCGWRRTAMHEHLALKAAKKHREVWRGHVSAHETTVAPITLDQVDPTVPMVGTLSADASELADALRNLGAVILAELERMLGPLLRWIGGRR